MANIVQIAYGLTEFQLLGGPSWIQSERFDVEARSDSAANDILAKLTPCQQRLTKEHMLQLILADRAHLAIHHGSKDVAGYNLILAKSGPKLHESAPDPNGAPHGGGMTVRANKLGYQLTTNSYSMDSFGSWLASETHAPVANKTGLTAKYDLALQWSEDLAADPSGSAIYPLIFTALPEQLGLKLEPTRLPIDTVIIDHIEKPSKN
jgi:uncharacterized protein (TIGR03435 family)